ncbi:MAG: DUF3800 domain-containing protein [Nitrospirota bacterium]
MLIFIDDSGDPGFKVGKGSSPVFVIALVIFDDELEAEETALKIKKLKRTMGLSDNYEFRFNKCSKDFRLNFLKAIADCEFRVRAIALRKHRIYGKELRNSRESFYNYAIKSVLKYHGGTIRDAKLRLDGHGDRRLKQALTTYLRRELNPVIDMGDKVFKNLKFVDSKKNVLIQLADMVAGTIRRSYNKEKEDSNLYREIILDRIEDVWDFGR